MSFRSKPLNRVLEKMDVGQVAHLNEDFHAFWRTVRRVIFGQLSRRRLPRITIRRTNCDTKRCPSPIHLPTFDAHVTLSF